MIRLWAFLMLSNVIFLALTVALARACRLIVLEVALGAGPRLFHRPVAGTDLSLRLLLWSSFVRFPDGAGMDSLPAPKRLTVGLGPFVALIALGLLGGAPVGLLLSLVPDFFDGALHPLSVARPLLVAAAQLAQEQPVHAFFRCCLFIGLINLLPVPGLGGWHVAQLLFGARIDKVAPVGLLFLVLSTASWLFAFIGTFTSS